MRQVYVPSGKNHITNHPSRAARYNYKFTLQCNASAYLYAQYVQQQVEFSPYFHFSTVCSQPNNRFCTVSLPPSRFLTFIIFVSYRKLNAYRSECLCTFRNWLHSVFMHICFFILMMTSTRLTVQTFHLILYVRYIIMYSVYVFKEIQ